MHMEECY